MSKSKKLSFNTFNHGGSDKNVASPVFCILAGTFLLLTSCNTVEDPEDPGFHKPAVSGVFSGEINTWEDYGNALEKENRKANRGEIPRWDDNLREDF